MDEVQCLEETSINETLEWTSLLNSDRIEPRWTNRKAIRVEFAIQLWFWLYISN